MESRGARERASRGAEESAQLVMGPYNVVPINIKWDEIPLLPTFGGVGEYYMPKANLARVSNSAGTPSPVNALVSR